MRKIIYFFLAVVIVHSCKEKKQQPVAFRAAFTPSSTWKKIPKDVDGGWYYTPGDTVLLDNDYDFITINDVHGAAGKPIVFINPTGYSKVGYRIKEGRGASILTQRCSYLVFHGIDAGSTLPDTYNAQGWNIQASRDLEIRNFKLHHSEVGFFTNQLTGHYPNIYIHDGEIYDINNKARTAFGEGFYIGQTSGKDLATTSLPNLRISDITMRNIGGDAIQLANCVNAQVRNVTVDGYGLNKVNNQFFGALNGGGTSCTWENVHMKNGSGTPFQILGTGQVNIRNCSAINCGTVDNLQDAFYIRQSFPTLSVGIYNTVVDRKNRNWVTVATPGVKIDSSGNRFGPLIVAPVRVDSVSRSLYDSVVKRNRENTEFINRP
jgi:hypothetical protein